MSVKRQKKRKITKIIIGGILLALCILGTVAVCFKLRKQKRVLPVDLYVLSCDKKAGEKVTEKDLKKIRIKDDTIRCSCSKDTFVGKELKEAFSKGTVLNTCMVCEEDTLGESLRQTSYSYIKQTAELKQGDYVDVRISFPNGADFIVLSKKKVLRSAKTEEQDGTVDTLYFALSEEEIMRMSSGVVDAYLTEGAYLYTVQYISDTQPEAVVNYPVNEVVAKLIKKDSNIIKIAQDAKTTELRGKIYDSLKGQEENVNSICDNEGLTYFK